MNIKALQAAIGVTADGVAGVATFTALFRKLGAAPDRAAALGVAANVHFPAYGIMENSLRLAHFMAQVGHESGSFLYMEEIWGPTAAQRGYEGRSDLGNNQPGDGKRFLGRGPIQITGRANYRRFGRLIGIDIEGSPEIAAHPSIGLHLALEYWKDRKLNDFADRDDVESITRRINGGLNGFDDRKARLTRLKGWLR